MSSPNFLSQVHFLVYPVFWSMLLYADQVSCMAVVEGFDGGPVVLPCNLTANGDLTWKKQTALILIKRASGAVIIQNGLFKGDVSLVNGADLRINTLRRNRDADNRGDKVFECGNTGGERLQIKLRLLVRITDVTIPEANGGSVTVTAGTPKAITCSVTGDPNPPPSYSWSVDGVTDSGQTSISYIFTPDKSMKNVTCTATNIYSNGSLLSVKEAIATLNVQYLDPEKKTDPFIATENNRAILKCSVEGNPPPRYEWRRSGFSEVKSSSADYIIDDVHRSAAGEYTCRYNNTIGSNSITAKLLVQYPPDVTVSYDNTTQILTCTAEGVPCNYSFSQWEHRLDGKLLQTLGTQSSGSTTILKLPGTLTYEDTGYYVCQVSNGIKSPLRGQVLVTPQRETATISVPFHTFSFTPNVKVVWDKSGESTVLTSHREKTGPVRLMIHGQSVSIDGTVTVLTLRDVTQSDEGNYTVTVTNDINGEYVSNKNTFFLYLTIPSKVDDTGSNANIGAAIGGGIAAVYVVMISVVVVVMLVRKNISGMKSEEAVRHPGDQTVDGFQNSQQGATVYQDLSINPDYVNTPDSQQYTTLNRNAREAVDYEQCDVPVAEGGNLVQHVAQYEDVSFPIHEGKPEYIDLCAGEVENKNYENKVFQKDSLKTYYNL